MNDEEPHKEEPEAPEDTRLLIGLRRYIELNSTNDLQVFADEWKRVAVDRGGDTRSVFWAPFDDCPRCGKAWDYKGIDGKTYSHAVGIGARAEDQTIEWMCPFCNARAPRGEIRWPNI